MLFFFLSEKLAGSSKILSENRSQQEVLKPNFSLWPFKHDLPEASVSPGHASVAQPVKNLPANVRDTGDASLVPGLRRSPVEGNGNPLQYFCLENSTDRGGWQATWDCKESDTTEHTHTYR